MNKKNNAEIRREVISELVIEQGYISIDYLMKLLNVSRMTIHRDLVKLEKMQILKKVRNGAKAQPLDNFDVDFSYRQTINVKAKRAIARLASRFLENGDSIILDNSTTVFNLIQFLSKFDSLTIISGGLPSILELIKLQNLNLISLGGDYNPHYQCFSGLIARQNIEGLMVNKCFISAASYKNGMIFHSTEHILSNIKTMLKHSIKKYLLIDHSKFEHIALHYMSDINIFDYVIVDEGISSGHLDNLKKHNANILVAKLNDKKS